MVTRLIRSIIELGLTLELGQSTYKLEGLETAIYTNIKSYTFV